MLIHCFNFLAFLFFHQSRTCNQLNSSAAFLKNCQNLKLLILGFEFSLIIPQNNLQSIYSTNTLKSNWEIQNQDWVKLKMKVSSTYVHRLFKWICMLVERDKTNIWVDVHCHGRGTPTGHPCKISLYSFLCWKYLIDLRSDNCNPKLLSSFTELMGKFKFSLNTCWISHALITGEDVSVTGYPCTPVCRKLGLFWHIQRRRTWVVLPWATARHTV